MISYRHRRRETVDLVLAQIRPSQTRAQLNQLQCQCCDSISACECSSGGIKRIRALAKCSVPRFPRPSIVLAGGWARISLDCVPGNSEHILRMLFSTYGLQLSLSQSGCNQVSTTG